MQREGHHIVYHGLGRTLHLHVTFQDVSLNIVFTGPRCSWGPVYGFRFFLFYYNLLFRLEYCMNTVKLEYCMNTVRVAPVEVFLPLLWRDTFLWNNPA